MLVGLRIISILYDLFLASMLFYRPLSKINMKKKPLVALFFILIFHGELVFLFSESRIFLVSNLLLNILEYYLIGLNFDYPIRQSSFWILLQTSLSLLAGAVLNQGIQLILPLGELSKNLEAISLYLGISFFLSTGITLILRKLLLSHQRLRIATSKGNWLYQFIVPLLSIFFQVREIQQSQEEYQRLQSLRHDLKNKHLTLLSLLEKNPEEAKDYLYSLTDSIVGEQTFYSKNQTINFLLNQKLHHLKDEIEMEIDCFVPQELSIQPDILAVILGNCLDNSIAACLRLPNKERNLSLNIRYFQQNLFINIRNNFDEKEKSTRKSRQKDGWGLRNIDALVQEYQGNIKHFIKDGQYQIEILLPIKIGTIPTKEF